MFKHVQQQIWFQDLKVFTSLLTHKRAQLPGVFFLQISINLPPVITSVSVWCSKDRRDRELKTSTYHFTRMSHSQIQEIGKIITKKSLAYQHILGLKT